MTPDEISGKFWFTYNEISVYLFSDFLMGSDTKYCEVYHQNFELCIKLNNYISKLSWTEKKKRKLFSTFFYRDCADGWSRPTSSWIKHDHHKHITTHLLSLVSDSSDRIAPCSLAHHTDRRSRKMKWSVLAWRYQGEVLSQLDRKTVRVRSVWKMMKKRNYRSVCARMRNESYQCIDAFFYCGCAT